MRSEIQTSGCRLIGTGKDLIAKNELWIQNKETREVDPVYCGPGIWYDKQSGRIHARFTHTHIENPEVSNYRGETDPRKLPVVLAPFDSVPLLIDQAMNVRFQDLIIRGGGFNTVKLQFGVNVEFDNLTVFCATYGLRANSTGPLKITNSGFHGGIPPWGFRNENSLHTYTPTFYDPFYPEPGVANRNIAPAAHPRHPGDRRHLRISRSSPTRGITIGKSPIANSPTATTAFT